MSALAFPVDSPPAYSTHRKVAELAAVVIGLGAIILLTPVDSPDYWIPTFATIGGVVLYVLYGLIFIPGAARRWGFIGSPRRADGVARSALWTVVLLLGSFLPVIAIRSVLDHPVLLQPKGYLFWCFVQDFVIFSLVLRNLLDFAPRHTAVWTAAALFGLSHYPYTGFMIVTGIAALWWGYVFASSRALWLVTLPHALLGVMVMGRTGG